METQHKQLKNMKILAKLEIISILDEMYKKIESGEVSEIDALTDAIDMIKFEVGYEWSEN